MKLIELGLLRRSNTAGGSKYVYGSEIVYHLAMIWEWNIKVILLKVLNDNDCTEIRSGVLG